MNKIKFLLAVLTLFTAACGASELPTAIPVSPTIPIRNTGGLGHISPSHPDHHADAHRRDSHYPGQCARVKTDVRGYIDPGSSAGGEPGADGVGAPEARARIAAVYLAPAATGGDGEALPGKEKTAAKGEMLTVVFLLIVIFQSISPSSLAKHPLGG